MFLASVVLAQLLQNCASNIDPRTMSAVVAVESGANPLALHDNTLGRSFAPSDTAQAVAWAVALVARGDSVDIGLSQVNSNNLPSLGLSVQRAFDPCANLRAGATILGNDYATASSRFGRGQYALRRALSAYNSGSMFAAQTYVDRILVAAGVAPDAPPAGVPVAYKHFAPRAPAPTAVATPKPPYTQTASRGSSVLVINGNP